MIRVSSMVSQMEMADKVLIFVSVWLAYQLLRAMYNISPLHPLSHVPGPKLAAATYLPEFYHDVIRVGRFTTEIRKMHQKYGPMVRINPDEVHCDDPKFVDEIYAAGGRKRDKSVHESNGFAVDETVFTTTGHDQHRTRRAAVAKFFSRATVSRLEDDIAALSQRMCDKILSQGGQTEPFDLATAYSSFSNDVISGYCFGESFGLLAQPGWYPNFHDPALSTVKSMFLFRFFPFLRRLKWIAVWLIEYLPRDIALLIKTMEIDIPNRAKKTKSDRDAGIVYSRPTIVEAILDSDLSEKDKQSSRLAKEILVVVGAGTETTSWTLAVITYHLLTKPDMLQRLRQELSTVDPQNLPPWNTLEKFPYLGAVIQEGLRLSYGVSMRTARIPTEESLVYTGEWDKKPVRYVIPRGCAIGMSAAITHHNEEVFPDSYAFKPERWLDPALRKDLDRAMLVFSKGSRACLGMNLGLCELHLALVAMVLRVLPRMRLYETTEQDVLYDYDLLIPMPSPESKGVRAIIV